ncbi:MAG: DNA repair protein RadA [Betaproteobacteria bacterium]|nr:DNA repair protein RadA [Betaproteobacteria bacterium]MDE2123392.1 DNA repair protein RadA [Betaproteobacteria bacterium]MDE2187709.1 DNA repair protein RadA [Betaproteobacteria bacterium]MDE2324717.1 DNA repair protein RadA [Betaproteobacteria bacterium]
MAKPQTVYVCSECGGKSAKWQGRCPHCEAWNTLVETVESTASGPRPGARHGAAAAQFAGRGGLAVPSGPILLTEVQAERHRHQPSGIDELDRVLGGGLVPGGVLLLGGDPGIGKSTLLLQVLAGLAADLPMLYISGEESAAQIALRAQRLGLKDAPVRLMAETQLEVMLDTLANARPAVAVIDSIQTVYTEALSSAPGSVSQVRECAAQLTRAAKTSGITLVLVGHVTKEGALAGPRVLEHMVDTVLYFEGDTQSRFRLIRAIKNRFGAVNELGVFAMTEHGLKGVSNPSAIFLSTHAEPVPGTCVLATLEGTRPLLVEVQALVDSAAAPSPRRLSVGLDAARLAMLLAVLHRHAGVASGDQDVFVNAVGGVRITEPAADLAVLLAIQSSLRNRPLPRGLLAFGEVGLAGEIRPAPRGQERLREAAKLGFSIAIIPAANAPKGASRLFEGLELHPVSRIDEALEVVRGLPA